MRVWEFIDNADVDVHKLARTTNTDPAIAAKLIRAANSPLYRGQSRIDQCDNAVVRLGLQTSRQLVSSFAVNELFNSDSPLLEKRTGELWRHSTEIAAISYVIASKTKTWPRSKRCSPDYFTISARYLCLLTRKTLQNSRTIRRL